MYVSPRLTKVWPLIRVQGALTENQAKLPAGAFEERVGMFAVKDKVDEQMQEA